MAAEILGPRFRLAHNRSGANLLSGVASTLLAAGDAELGLFEVDEAALPEVVRRVRPRAVCLGNLFRDQLDRYGELELVAERWRDGRRGAPAEATIARRERRRPAGRRPRAAHADATVFGLDDPRVARPALQHAADSKYCLRCGTPYDYAAAYVGHLGDYRCPTCGHARPHARRRRPRRSSSHGLERRRLRPRAPGGDAPRRARAPRPLQRLQRASAPRRSRTRSARRSTRSSPGSGASAPPSAASSGSPSATRRMLLLLIKNPAGANEAIRTLVDGGAAAASPSSR